MITCDVVVRPDQTRYVVGEAVTGEVDLWADERWPCHALVVSLVLHPAHVIVSEVLFEGELQPNEKVTRRFSLPLPGRPANDGRADGASAIRWRLVARADLPRALDPEHTVDLDVGYPEGAAPRVAPPPAQTRLAVAHGGGGLSVIPSARVAARGRALRWELLGPGAGLVGGGVALWPVVELSGVAVVAGAVGVGLLVAGVLKSITSRTLGGVAVDWSQDEDDPWLLHVDVRLSEATTVRAVRAQLFVVALRHQALDDKAKRLWSSDAELPLVAGASQHHRGRVRLPPRTLFSWDGPGSGRFWYLDVHVDVPGVDGRQRFRLDVTPALSGPSGAATTASVDVLE